MASQSDEGTKTGTSNTNILATSGIGQLMFILQEHLEIIQKKDAAVEQMISTAQTAESLRQAKKVALDNEKNLLLSILTDIGEMNSFLENIILIENLFNSVYQPYKQQQEEARAKYAPTIAQYESRPKVQSEAASFIELIFGGQTHISSFKTWLAKVEKQCKIQNINILKSSGAKVKQIERAFYKAHYVYDEQAGFREMTDILRCSFVFDNFSDLYQCFSVIETLAEQTLGGVLRVKDRYHPTAIPFGYRDLLINVFCPSSKIVAEIQLHFIEFYKYKNISHTMYKTARLFEREETNEAYEYATKHKRPKIGTFKVYKVSKEEMEDGDEKGDDEDAKEAKQAKDMKYDELLKAWGLAKYINKMKDEGWDDTEDWNEIEDEDLKNEIGFNKGHIKKFRRKYDAWLKQIESEKEPKISDDLAIYQEHVYDNKQPKRRLSKMREEDEKQAAVTYIGLIPYKAGDAIADGDTIIITAAGITESADQWAVNLRIGNNIALHFNPRPFTDGAVVRNTYVNNSWQHEERAGGLQVAADENAAIAVEFRKTATKWEITCNGRRIPAYDFNHRLSGNITDVQYRGMKGAVTVSVQRALPQYKAGDRISDGDSIIVTADGMIESAHQWVINLLVGKNIALHFNPRPFTDGAVVRNTSVNNGWQHEERQGGLQVAADKMAAIAVEFKKTPTKWEITCNRKRIPAYDFNHRLSGDITDVQYGGMKGAVTVCIRRGLMPYKAGDRISDGDSIMITADGITESANQWAVNLRVGNNIALHFNPRPFTDGAVVRNTYVNNSWQHEERAGGLQVAADKKAAIVVEFRKTTTKWEISCNGRRIPAYDFKHRLTANITDVEYRGMKGDVMVSVKRALPLYKTGDRISDGDSIIVTADGMTESAHQWAINLFAGNNHALHFNPRPFENVVVRNTKVNNSWQHEERAGGLQVAADKKAAIAVEFKKTATKWEITCNGRRIPAYDFKHRLSADITDVQYRGMKGAVTVSLRRDGYDTK